MSEAPGRLTPPADGAEIKWQDEALEACLEIVTALRWKRAHDTTEPEKDEHAKRPHRI